MFSRSPHLAFARNPLGPRFVGLGFALATPHSVWRLGGSCFMSTLSAVALPIDWMAQGAVLQACHCAYRLHHEDRSSLQSAWCRGHGQATCLYVAFLSLGCSVGGLSVQQRCGGSFAAHHLSAGSSTAGVRLTVQLYTCVGSVGCQRASLFGM